MHNTRRFSYLQKEIILHVYKALATFRTSRTGVMFSRGGIFTLNRLYSVMSILIIAWQLVAVRFLIVNLVRIHVINLPVKSDI